MSSSKSGLSGADAARKFAVPLGFFLILAVMVLSAAFSMSTKIEPGHIGVIVNNVTGKVQLQAQPGVVYHLPWGMTDVYPLESKLQVHNMSAVSAPRNRDSGGDRRRSRAAPNPTASRLKVKSIDGGDVYMDLTINYQLIAAKGAEVAQKVGVGDAFKSQLLKAYARSRVRDILGTLTIGEMSDASLRREKLNDVAKVLDSDLSNWGLDILTVAATNFSFNTEYEQLIKERKNADQDLTNQASAQLTAEQEQVTEVNTATREKNVQIRKVQGVLAKRVIEANGLAEKLKTQADGKAYAIRKKGDQSLEVARAEAEAIEAEGKNRAAGITKLSQAYQEGGLALVMEALAAKYEGRSISGRPYNLDSNVSRLQIEEAAAARKGGN